MSVFSFKGSVNEDENINDNNEEVLESEDITENEEWVGQIALDIIETESDMTIIVPIAGLDIDDIEIEIKDYVLSIEGERKRLPIYGEWDILVQECFFGKFARSIIMPENLNFDEISAVMENNLLVIKLPKHVHASKTIKINRHEM